MVKEINASSRSPRVGYCLEDYTSVRTEYGACWRGARSRSKFPPLFPSCGGTKSQIHKRNISASRIWRAHVDLLG